VTVEKLYVCTSRAKPSSSKPKFALAKAAGRPPIGWGFSSPHPIALHFRRKCKALTAILVLSLSAVLFTAPQTVEGSYEPVQTRRHIPWLFYTYTQPDFRSQRLESFNPQDVTIIRESGDWALINTASGEAWVYTAANRIYIDKVMPIYNFDDETIMGRINPQVVTILERRDNLLKIETWLGPGWIDLDFMPPVQELEDFIRPFGNTVSVYYENLESGFVFRHNSERDYFGGSATKAHLALYIYHKAELGETDLDSIHTYTSADYWGGSGIIRQRYNVGARFTQRELLHLMITPSDNIATRILRRIHGLDGLRTFIESIGGNPDFIQTLTYSRLSADEAGLIMREIYKYTESESLYGHEFRDNLLANRYPFIISDHPVASKSGWAANFGGAYHDMAIVYAPSPYVLTILSNRNGTAADKRLYENISMRIQEFNDNWFLPLSVSEAPEIEENEENMEEETQNVVIANLIVDGWFS